MNTHSVHYNLKKVWPVFPEADRLDHSGRPTKGSRETSWAGDSKIPAPSSLFTDERAAECTGPKTHWGHRNKKAWGGSAPPLPLPLQARWHHHDGLPTADPEDVPKETDDTAACP